MLLLMFALFSHPQFAACGCHCVDGVPRTLCQSIEEARVQPRLCPAQMRCPVDEHHGEQDPLYFDAPDEQAHSCREVRIWNPEQGAYAGVKICDVFIS